jgi:hypothetical protein
MPKWYGLQGLIIIINKHAVAVLLQVPHPPKQAAHLPCDVLVECQLCPLTKAVMAPM